jgi:hypothetical protein
MVLGGTLTRLHSDRRIYSYLFWILCAGLLLAWHTPNRLDSDEGVILSGAWHLLNGQAIYFDFFEFIAPGSFYLIFWLWKLFGAHFLVAKLAAVAAIMAAGLGVYRIGLMIVSHERLQVPPWTLFIGPLAYCLMTGYWPAINHNTFNIALVVWATYFVARSILHRSFRDAAVGGLVSGVAIVFLQHRGLTFAGGVIVILGFFYARDRDQSWLRTAAIFVLGLAVPITTLLLLWPPSLLFENLVRFPATNYPEVNWVDPSLFLLTGSSLVVAAWLLCSMSSRGVWFLLLLQGALFLTALQRPDLSHITITLFPILSLFPVVLTARRLSLFPTFFRFWSVGGPLVLLFPVLFYASTNSSWFVDRSENSSALRYIRENCRSSPHLYAGPFASGLYYETRKLNPTRYSALLTKLNTNEQFVEAARDLETHRPQCVVTNYAMVEKFSYDRNNALDQYIATRYELVHREGPVQVLVAR